MMMIMMMMMMMMMICLYGFLCYLNRTTWAARLPVAVPGFIPVAVQRMSLIFCGGMWKTGCIALEGRKNCKNRSSGCSEIVPRSVATRGGQEIGEGRLHGARIAPNRSTSIKFHGMWTMRTDPLHLSWTLRLLAVLRSRFPTASTRIPMSLLSYQKVTQVGITATVLSLLHVVQVLRNLKRQQDSGICPQPLDSGL